MTAPVHRAVVLCDYCGSVALFRCNHNRGNIFFNSCSDECNKKLCSLLSCATIREPINERIESAISRLGKTSLIAVKRTRDGSVSESQDGDANRSLDEDELVMQVHHELAQAYRYYPQEVEDNVKKMVSAIKSLKPSFCKKNGGVFVHEATGVVDRFSTPLDPLDIDYKKDYNPLDSFARRLLKDHAVKLKDIFLRLHFMEMSNRDIMNVFTRKLTEYLFESKASLINYVYPGPPIQHLKFVHENEHALVNAVLNDLNKRLADLKTKIRIITEPISENLKKQIIESETQHKTLVAGIPETVVKYLDVQLKARTQTIELSNRLYNTSEVKGKPVLNALSMVWFTGEALRDEDEDFYDDLLLPLSKDQMDKTLSDIKSISEKQKGAGSGSRVLFEIPVHIYDASDVLYTSKDGIKYCRLDIKEEEDTEDVLYTKQARRDTQNAHVIQDVEDARHIEDRPEKTFSHVVSLLADIKVKTMCLFDPLNIGYNRIFKDAVGNSTEWTWIDLPSNFIEYLVAYELPPGILYCSGYFLSLLFCFLSLDNPEKPAQYIAKYIRHLVNGRAAGDMLYIRMQELKRAGMDTDSVDDIDDYNRLHIDHDEQVVDDDLAGQQELSRVYKENLDVRNFFLRLLYAFEERDYSIFCKKNAIITPPSKPRKIPKKLKTDSPPLLSLNTPSAPSNSTPLSSSTTANAKNKRSSKTPKIPKTESTTPPPSLNTPSAKNKRSKTPKIPKTESTTPPPSLTTPSAKNKPAAPFSSISTTPFTIPEKATEKTDQEELLEFMRKTSEYMRKAEEERRAMWKANEERRIEEEKRKVSEKKKEEPKKPKGPRKKKATEKPTGP